MWRRCVPRPRASLPFMIVCASIFAGAPVSAQAPDPIKDINGRAAALQKKIKELKTEQTIKPPLDPHELAELATAISKAADAGIVAKAWATTLTALVTPPTPTAADARQKPDFTDTNLRKASRKLAEANVKFTLSGSPLPIQPVNDVNAQATALVIGLEKRMKPQQDATDKDLDSEKLAELATSITGLLEPTLAVTVWANDLASILVDRKPDMTGELKDALDKLALALPALPATLGPYLNIVQAWFGDLLYVRRAVRGQLRINPVTGAGPRVCDATNEVRSACQGKGTCPYNSAAKLDPARLCGEDPVPFASKDITGLAVEFQCLQAAREGPNGWDDLQNNWRALPEQPRSQMVMLRQGTDVTLRCAADLAPVGPAHE